jgi:hypothetical protein
MLQEQKMNFNDLLQSKQIDTEQVLVLRHRPSEPELNKVFPLLVADREDLFNAYQQIQRERLEKAMAAMVGGGYLASFIAHGPGRALFIGLYEIASATPLTFEQYWEVPANKELKEYGMQGFTGDRPSVLLFALPNAEFYPEWKGKLVVEWPPPERSWWRRAHRNEIPVRAILEESALEAAVKHWREIDLTWNQLRILPSRWKAALAEWRAIYYIYDVSDGKGYVGSAYGAENLLGRWLNYAVSGHGGNRLLRERDPRNFHFTILERVSPDMYSDDVIRLEATWKDRLHSRAPAGLNDN